MATILVLSGDDLAAKVQAAQAGDVVQLTSATWTLVASFFVPSGVTLQGSIDGVSEIIFNLSGQDLHGIVIPANASNIAIRNVDIVSSNGLIKMCDGQKYNGITITGCSFQYGGGQYANGTDVFGIFATIPGVGLTISDNLFHDSPASNRNWELYNQTNLTIAGNTFHNIVDGGHVVEPGNNFVFEHNTGSGLQRMGQEVQGNGVVTGMQVTNNTFYDWRNPYQDSFGMSLVMLNAVSPLIQSNYVEFSMAPGAVWGPVSETGYRFGYGYEIGGTNVQLLSNTFVATQVCGAGFCTASKTTYAKGNTSYDAGKFAEWGDFTAETGGAYTNQATLLTDNLVTGTNPPPPPLPNVAPVPAPVAAVAAPTPAPVVTPVAAPSPTPVTVTPPSGHSVPIVAPPAPAVTLRTGTVSLVQSDGSTRSWGVSVMGMTPPKHATSGTLVLTCSDGTTQTFKLVL
jgi:hypothetical protein